MSDVRRRSFRLQTETVTNEIMDPVMKMIGCNWHPSPRVVHPECVTWYQITITFLSRICKPDSPSKNDCSIRKRDTGWWGWGGKFDSLFGWKYYSIQSGYTRFFFFLKDPWKEILCLWKESYLHDERMIKTRYNLEFSWNISQVICKWNDIQGGAKVRNWCVYD